MTRILSDHDLDPTQDLIPVAPALHYAMGGIRTDLDGRTTRPGLWAVGEVACTGVHGANRLASNSLIEGMVFADRVAKALIADSRDPAGGASARTPGPTRSIPRRQADELTARLRGAVTRSAPGARLPTREHRCSGRTRRRRCSSADPRPSPQNHDQRRGPGADRNRLEPRPPRTRPACRGNFLRKRGARATRCLSPA